ncbi:hypothetical protein MCOR31_004960 [Pyricularia oryzae]|nr:hypothetical protein MCOR31_004960 [Pyricularia oryzae]KAI6429659.1 hypothetical protein MCOR21_004935 [Pyricularia oryzae]
MANRWSKLGVYRSNETYADLTVVTDDNQTFRLHRVVVCAMSLYFETACNSNFQEANTQTLHLPGVDGNVFRKVAEFIYSGTYTEDGCTDLHPHPQALEHVTPEDLGLQVTTLGDFLGAAGRVGNVVSGFLSHLEQAAILYTTAERLLILELKILSLRRFGFFAVLLMLALVLMRTGLLVKLAFRLQGSPSHTTSAPREKWERDEESRDLGNPNFQ